MVKYVSPGPNLRPIKMQPFQLSSGEWATLANHCHDIDPSNSLRAHIIQDDDWIKETWTDCCKCLNQTFTQYHRSRQHDPEMDEWYSKKELDRWVRGTILRLLDRTQSFGFQVLWYTPYVLWIWWTLKASEENAKRYRD
jgi:hypothetical protein